MRQDKRNVPASILGQLKQLSEEQKEDFNYILVRYANIQLLYRLSKSKYKDQFILKGAMLYISWTRERYRSTKDLDFLGYGANSGPELEKIFKKICSIEIESDGLRFDLDSIKSEEIREDQEYNGQRIKLIAFLGNAKISLQVDIGFGDVVTPEAELQSFPVLLDMPKPKIRTYSKESVIAEKLQAIVKFGMINSRLKDYYDLYTLSKQFDFEGAVLTEAIKNTFERRETTIPAVTPIGLSGEFSSDKEQQKRWQAFLRKSNSYNLPSSLETIIK